MIKWLSTWAQGIIVAVIVATIIEIILPNGSIKKYIKVIIGMYILFTIIYPIMNKISAKSITLENIINTQKYNSIMEQSNEKTHKTFESSNSKTIKDIYKENIEKDIKEKIEQKGYEISNEIVSIIENESTYRIKEINLSIHRSKRKLQNKISNTQINSVNININCNSKATENDQSDQIKLNKDEITELQKFLSETYGINMSQVKIE